MAREFLTEELLTSFMWHRKRVMDEGVVVTFTTMEATLRAPYIRAVIEQIMIARGASKYRKT